MTQIDGIIKITMRKFTGTIMPANIPKVRMGRRSLEALAKNATAVVLEVIAMALKERLKAYAILRYSSLAIRGMRAP